MLSVYQTMMSRKKLLEKPRFELAAKGVLQTGKMLYLLAGRSRSSGGPATGKARIPTVDCLTGGTRRRLMLVERSDRLPGRLRRTSGWKVYGGALPREEL